MDLVLGLHAVAKVKQKTVYPVSKKKWPSRSKRNLEGRHFYYMVGCAELTHHRHIPFQEQLLSVDQLHLSPPYKYAGIYKYALVIPRPTQ